MTILVTGAAGFCGRAVTEALLRGGDRVVGVDNLSDYYSPQLKRDRLATLSGFPGFDFVEGDIADSVQMQTLVRDRGVTRVVHLAAQPGVRYSISHPATCVQANLTGFAAILEVCRAANVEHFVYASSSSVYGANARVPFSESDAADHPLSLYAASKRANELMAHSYSHLFGLPTTGLRFFTVYGPWGRPDMAPWLFTDAMLAGRPIRMFNEGRSLRDFTFIDDVAAAVCRVLRMPPKVGDALSVRGGVPGPHDARAPYRVLNVGNETPVPLVAFVDALERALGVRATRVLEAAQPGDMDATHADVTRLRNLVGTAPGTPLADGLAAWASWYRSYHRLPSGAAFQAITE